VPISGEAIEQEARIPSRTLAGWEYSWERRQDPAAPPPAGSENCRSYGFGRT